MNASIAVLAHAMSAPDDFNPLEPSAYVFLFDEGEVTGVVALLVTHLAVTEDGCLEDPSAPVCS